MKLFGDFEAIRFPEENLILVTSRGYLYYIYDPRSRHWRKHANAGNDRLSVQNYPDVSRFELENAMGGTFPKKETDFMRQCRPGQLRIRDMLELLREDHPRCMADGVILDAVRRLLLESDICHKSYARLKVLFEDAAAEHLENGEILRRIRELSISMTGKDIFRREIGIVDGHDSSSYFWIMPVRVLDPSDTSDLDNIAEMRSVEISIEETDVEKYLAPFLYRHFDETLEANRRREDANGFEWYLTYNFYTYAAVRKILKEIADTADALHSGEENVLAAKLRMARKADSGADNHAEIERILDFYERFRYRMEYMMRVGAENGYDLISFMGP